MNQVLGLLVVALLVAASAYFVAVEFSFTAANRNRLVAARDAGDRRAGSALRVLERLSFCLSGAQLGITLAALVTGFVAEPVFAAVFEPVLGLLGVPEATRGPASLALGFVVSTFALMVLGELAPKNLAIAVPERVARSLARSTLLFLRVGGPVIRLFDGAANALLRRLGITPLQEAHGTATMEDLAQIIDGAGAAGQLTAEESGLLGRALDFGDLTAAAVMVPRPQVSTLREDATGAQLRELLRCTGHSRVPLVRGPQETVVGVLSVKAFLDLPPDRRDTAPVSVLAAPVLRLPETAPLADVVAQMRRFRSPFAVAVDEAGDDVGILTLEDVVEELVGEVYDEYDRAPSVAAAQDVLDGSMRLHEVAQQRGVRLPEGEYETLAGLILTRLARLARVGDRLDVDGTLVGDGSQAPVTVELRVLSLEARRVGDVHLSLRTDARTATVPVPAVSAAAAAVEEGR